MYKRFDRLGLRSFSLSCFHALMSIPTCQHFGEHCSHFCVQLTEHQLLFAYLPLDFIWIFLQVRSATLDTWLPEQVAFIQSKLVSKYISSIFFLFDFDPRLGELNINLVSFLCSYGK